MLNLVYALMGQPVLPNEEPPTLDPLRQTSMFLVPDPHEESYYRGLLLDVHNAHRGNRPLAISEALCGAALAHCADMARRGRLDHADFAKRAKNWNFRAENVAWGHSDAEQVWYHRRAGWYYSQGHRQNALNPGYTIVGFGRNGVYWCAVYA